MPPNATTTTPGIENNHPGKEGASSDNPLDIYIHRITSLPGYFMKAPCR
jgi:hypothetical protein|tara:strand:+ start:3995 stop:4141 length:147 start_codon:yes stop_codon:yes gene_type:complete